jgi:hypothetical protein
VLKTPKKPALSFPHHQLKQVMAALLQAGYEVHTGRKMLFRNEVATLRKVFGGRGNTMEARERSGRLRQCHVQFVCDGKERTESGKKVVKVFAHTEPVMSYDLLDIARHGLALLTDTANYATGARMIRKDLKIKG